MSSIPTSHDGYYGAHQSMPGLVWFTNTKDDFLSLVMFDEYLHNQNLQAQLDFLRTGFTYSIRVSMVIRSLLDIITV